MTAKEKVCDVCKGRIWIDDEGKVHREWNPECSPWGTWKEHDCLVKKKPSELGLK